MAIPPEVIDYVAAGRNPDIYTREFVEETNHGNQVLNGAMQAFGQFSEILAKQSNASMPEMAGDMDRLMEQSGRSERDEQGDWKMKARKEGA
jgi:mediator of RNA polymerase II transcription subunit 10